MNDETPIARAVRLAGSQAALARKVKVSQPTVWDWVRKGQVPAEYAKPIEDATNGEVTRHQLRPDLWPTESAA